MLRQALLERLRNRFGDKIDLMEQPEVIDEILASAGASGGSVGAQAGPFGVPWMDSLVAHWVFAKEREAAVGGDMVDTLMAKLVASRFRARIAEIDEIVGRRIPGLAEPPDGGTPEPGVPPVGPAIFSPPDGGPPEPGTPPAGPIGGFGEIEDNPWILYWFLSIRAPMLLDVVDLHIDRRLQEIAERAGRR